MSEAAVSSSMSAIDSQVDAAERLIVALDVETVAEAKRIVAELRPTVSFFKVAPALQWDEGFRPFISGLLGDRCQIFLDYKFSDIGSAMRRNVAGVAGVGVDFLTLQGTSDLSEADLRYAMLGRQKTYDRQLKVFLVTVLTSLDQQDLEKNGTHEPLVDRVVKRAEMADRAGLDGVIASGLEASAIRNATRQGFLIVTPAIRPKGFSPDEQKRTCTPYEAVINGANYLVVGRPIIKSPNKRAAAEAIIEEMRQALDE